jgi:hypothetical protein
MFCKLPPVTFPFAPPPPGPHHHGWTDIYAVAQLLLRLLVGGSSRHPFTQAIRKFKSLAVVPWFGSSDVSRTAILPEKPWRDLLELLELAVGSMEVRKRLGSYSKLWTSLKLAVGGTRGEHSARAPACFSFDYTPPGYSQSLREAALPRPAPGGEAALPRMVRMARGAGAGEGGHHPGGRRAMRLHGRGLAAAGASQHEKKRKSHDNST